MLQTQRSRRWASATAATAGLTAATAVIAMAARAPLSGATPVDAVSARAPVTALAMVFVGAGIVALAAIAMSVWPGRGRQDDDEPEFVPAPLQLHWIWKLLAVVLPFALGAALVAAAVLGVRTMHAAPRFAGGGGPARSPVGTSAPTGAGTGFVLPAWLPWTVLVIVVVAIAAGVLLLVRGQVMPADEQSERTPATWPLRRRSGRWTRSRTHAGR